MKMKKIAAFLLCIVIASSCVACSDQRNDEANKTLDTKLQEQEEAFNINEFIDNIDFMQNDDMGLHAVSNGNTHSLYMTLYETFYAVLVCQKFDFTDLIYSQKIGTFLSHITIEQLVNQQNDDLSLMYYFTQLSKFVNFSIDGTDIQNEIVQAVQELYSESGFFYCSFQDKDAHVTYDYNDPRLLSSCIQALTILGEDVMGTEKADICSFFREVVNQTDFSNPENLFILAEIKRIYELCDVDFGNEIIDDEMIGAVASLMNKDDCCSMSYLLDITELFQDNNGLNDYKNEIVSSVFDLYDNGAFSAINGGEKFIHATYQAISILEKIEKFDLITADMLIEIYNYVYAHMMYDGLYSFEELESSIVETYYCIKILENFDTTDTIYDSLNQYLQSHLENLDYENRDLDTIILLKYAQEHSIPLNGLHEVWNSFFQTQLTGNLTTSPELLLIVLETIKSYSYPLPNDISNYFEEYFNSLEKTVSFSQNDDKSPDGKIISNSLIYLLYLAIDKPVDSNTVENLISDFCESYESLQEKIYVSYWVVKLMYEYNISFALLDLTANQIISEINSACTDSFYGYNSNNISFESTYNILMTLNLVSEKRKETAVRE